MLLIEYHYKIFITNQSYSISNINTYSETTLNTVVLLLDKLQELTRINQYTLDLLRMGDIRVRLRLLLDYEVARIYPAEN